jgi:hypothetical protein
MHIMKLYLCPLPLHRRTGPGGVSSSEIRNCRGLRRPLHERSSWSHPLSRAVRAGAIACPPAGGFPSPWYLGYPLGANLGFELV